MLKKLLVVLAILALAAPAFALVASKDGTVITDPTTPNDATSARSAFEFNTGGAWDFPPTTNGSASGWSYYIIPVFTNETGGDLMLSELGFPTNEYTADPIPVPVEWNIYFGSNYMDITDPYTFAWTYMGTFMPLGAIDTSPPDTYTPVDVTGEGIVLPDGATMVWGYENAGLCGQTDFNGVVTIGWYVSYWDPDDTYGRTGLMQFGAGAGTAAMDASMGAVKALY